MAPIVKVERLPFGKRFGVSFVDDTDGARVDTTSRAYELLSDHEIRCTKTVWPFKASAPSGGYGRLLRAADTLQQKPYRVLCEKLHAAGFEIAMHTASAGDSKREETLAAYEFFESVFGHPPATNVMHGRNQENIYWGRHSVANGMWRKLISRVEPIDFSGHQPSSEYYWGDVCREKTRYVRQFETLSVNTLRFDKATPYHDSEKPDVAWWFSSSYGGGSRLFTLLSKRNIERLAAERGASIVHTYLHHYARRGQHRDPPAPAFRSLIRQLAEHDDGWYVPVVTLLDRLRAIRTLRVRSDATTIWIQNASDMRIDDLALQAPEGFVVGFTSPAGRESRRNAFGQVNVGSLRPGEVVGVITRSPRPSLALASSPPPDYNKLASGYARRVTWQFTHGRHRMVSWR